MSFVLFNNVADDLHLNHYRWNFVFNLAVCYGWEPQGTLPPRINPHEPEDPVEARRWLEAVANRWEGGYFSNDYQIMTGDDATALADALRRALASHDGDELPIPEEMMALWDGGAFVCGPVLGEDGQVIFPITKPPPTTCDKAHIRRAAAFFGVGEAVTIV